VAISSPNSTAFYPLDRLHQGPGVGFASEPPHDALPGAAQTWVTNQPNGSGDYYANGVPAPMLVIDLGADTRLTEISTWGYADGNANGVRTFNLRFATAAEGPNGFGASLPGQSGFTANASAVLRHSHPLIPVTARYVEFTATDNYRGYGNPGGDRVGLGEISFEDVTDPKIEVPETLTLDLDGALQTIGITVRNGGAAETLQLTGTTLSGPQAAAFTLISAPATLAPGAAAEILLSFNPTGQAGFITAALEITSNDLSKPVAVIRLSGFLHDPKLVVADTLDFGLSPPGAGPVERPLALTNQGHSLPLAITNVALAGPDAARFAVSAPPASLAPQATGSLAVTFDPGDRLGGFAARLELTTTDAANPVRVVNLAARVALIDPGSGPRLNEFMAANTSSLRDGDGNRPDWIELHNPGAAAVDLAGWHLTDRANNLTKWTFPPVTLPAGGYLVVFASGQAASNYIDAGGNLHTNFNLSAAGEYLGLVMPDGRTIVSEFHPAFPAQFDDLTYGHSAAYASAETNAISGSVPAWLVPADGNLALTWTQNAFVPGSGWFTGTGQGLGYDLAADYDPYLSTNVQAQMYNIRQSLYARFPFPVADQSAVSALTLAIRYDDGFVAYLNGVEIARRNAPASPAWNSGATTTSPEPGFETIDVSAFLSHLQNGSNVLALHGLNRGVGSSDFLIQPELRVTTRVSTPPGIGYLSSPTPCGPNSGSALPGPLISQVTPAPGQPVAGQNTIITARVTARLAPVAAVTLRYRKDYEAETAVAMGDDGSGGDLAAGDGVFTGVIPAAAHVAGRMLRWAVSATDTAGSPGRAPAFLARTGTDQSPEYFGTLIPDPLLVSELPVFHWFTQDPGAAHTAAGTRACVSFAGRFYDNVYVRQRGGATNGTVSQKFDFNKGAEFHIDETMPAVDEINLNGNGSDPTYVRQPLAFETYRRTGQAACNSDLWQLRVNGATDRVGVFVEQVDDSFLSRNGYDPDGDLYKITGYELAPSLSTAAGGFEKKTGNKADSSSFAALVAGLNLPTSAERRRFVIDHLDLPQILNYLALRSITQDADDVRKNYYVYQDSRGDRRWRIFPWDKDWTFGITGDGGTWLAHPFFADEEHAKQNANQWNVLYDVMFEETTTQRLYLRRLRTLMDSVLQPAGTPPAERLLEARAAAIIDPATPPLGADVSAINTYLANRRVGLATNYPALIPAAQPAAPVVAITGADFNPPSGNQDHEYIILTNSEATEIDLSGWTLSGGAGFTFQPGTVIERGGNLYVSPAPLAFRQRPVSPTGNEERLVVGPYAGHLSNFGETLTLADAGGRIVSTYVTPAAPSDVQLHLVISEIQYHPEPDGDAEFIELLNISPTLTLDLSGVKFTAGVRFAFGAGTALPPGGRVVIVKSTAAFQSVHGPAVPIAGEFAEFTSLANAGELLKLEDAGGSTIAEFSYDDAAPWPVAADGGGSLVLVAPHTRPDPALPQNWRASLVASGNPATDDALHFTGTPTGDTDQDGRRNLVEYVLGEDADPAWRPGAAGGWLEVPWVPNADDALIVAEFSSDLSHWTPGLLVAAGVSSRTYAPPPALAGASRIFGRAVVRLR
jgi:hypothetical protein